MAARRCEYCHRVYVQWLTCRDGRRRLFEHAPVEIGELAPGQRGWLPGRVVEHGRATVAMAPIEQVGRGKAAAARRVMVRHHCAEFERLYGAVFEEVDG